MPAALLAVGAVYVYSFPGLLWLAGTAVVWLVAELASGRRPVDPRSAGLALLVFVVGAAPEIGRMVDFHSFETFDPNGPGLGNLFGQISPFEALGIWPSGDFRLAPGDGAVPAAGYYLGAAFGTVLLALRDLAALAPPRAGDPLRPLHLRRRLRRRPRRRHPLHRRQGDRDRRPPRRPHHPARHF